MVFYENQNKKIILNNSKIFSFSIIIFLYLFNKILNECDRENPIKFINGSCSFPYCEKNEYNSGECMIDNKIIRTQFPNNIIFVGTKSLRYLNFITFSNGDMLFQTSSYPGNNMRIFYGLKKNGRGYFIEENTTNETPFFSLKEENNKQYKFESTNSIYIKDGKECFISLGRMDSYCEIFDYEKKVLISEKSNTLISFVNYNYRSNLIKINSNSNSYILSTINNDWQLEIIKFDLLLDNNNKLNISSQSEYSGNYGFGEIGRCFLIELKNIIICFYGYIQGTIKNYLISAIKLDNSTFIQKGKEIIEPINEIRN